MCTDKAIPWIAASKSSDQKKLAGLEYFNLGVFNRSWMLMIVNLKAVKFADVRIKILTFDFQICRTYIEFFSYHTFRLQYCSVGCCLIVFRQ